MFILHSAYTVLAKCKTNWAFSELALQSKHLWVSCPMLKHLKVNTACVCMTIVISLGHTVFLEKPQHFLSSCLLNAQSNQDSGLSSQSEDKKCYSERGTTGRRVLKWKKGTSDGLGCPVILWDAASCFYVVLCITDLLLHTHPLSCGHAHHLSHIFHQYSQWLSSHVLPGSQFTKNTPQTHTHKRYRLYNLHIKFML